MSSPNILLIQVDQLTASFLPSYGNTVAKTPNIDALSERSVIFDAAYTNFALCAPSRFSMLSGRLASEVDAYDNGAEFSSSIPTFAHYLKGAGYHTALSGKMHFVGPDQLHGYDERLTTDIYPSSFAWTGDWNEVTESHSNDARSFTLAGPCVRNVQLDYDDEVLHRARRKLFDLARSVGVDRNQPWHLTVSFTHPHEPYQCTHEDWNRYDHDEIDMPSIGRLDDPDPYSLRLRQQYGLADFVPTEGQIRNARHGYYGSVSYVDGLVGELLATLEQAGMTGDTVIVFTTDHGDMLGERGLWYKRSFYEDSTRVPLMICWPGQLDAGRVATNVSLVDLLPTFLDIAGFDGDAPEPVELLDGASLLPLATGEAAAGPTTDVVYGENLSEGATAPVLMVKRGSMKYVWSGCDPAQLYDVATDPAELTDLAGDAGHVDTQAELDALVHARWDVEALTTQVLASQARRGFLRGLNAGGGGPDWRHVPSDQAAIHALPKGVNYNDWAFSNVLDGPTTSAGSQFADADRSTTTRPPCTT